jgi:hypothetical protein
MKKYIDLKILSVLLLLIPACNQDLLDKNPLDKYSDATVWTDPNLAASYLNYCYDNVGHGIRGEMLTSIADESFVSRGSSSQPYNLGTLNADRISGTYSNVSWANFANIQRINLFLDNIDNIAENFSEPKKSEVKVKTDLLKGEALFLRAYIYTNMCRTFGGVPLMNKANKLGDDLSTIKRSTFKETVDFIIKDCDDAIQLLKLKSGMRMGKATKEAAMALKSRILLFAASDLTSDGTAESELVGYTGPNRIALWTAARDAAKAVIDLGTCKLADWGAPDQAAVAKNRFDFFKAYTLANDEVIWGKMFVADLGSRHRNNQQNGPNGINNFGRNGPLQSMVDSYEMSDGSKFSGHFTVNASNQYKNVSTKFKHENPYYNREPRFYADVLYDSAVWQPRFANSASRDPLGIYERRTHRTMTGPTTYTDVFGLDTRKDPYFPAGGCYGGYLMKKFMDNTVVGDVQYNQNIWIYIRYAEVLLNYAEACLMLGDIPTATTYLNMIRNRAGLPDFTGDITQALRQERKIELFGEENRWFDIRRWKILEATLSPPLYGIDILEIKNLDGTYTTTWTRLVSQQANVPNKRMYWIPISTDEMKKAPQLVQNPGY